MHHIIYVSTATRLLDPAELQQLLREARLRNARYHVTGILLYHEGRITQILEGDEAAVRYLYERIERDPRHRGVVKLADEPLPHRRFAQWHMAYWETEPDELAYAAGYIPLQHWQLPPGRFSEDDVLRLEALLYFVTNRDEEQPLAS
jgi:Sensors of blue-light using FAD